MSSIAHRNGVWTSEFWLAIIFVGLVVVNGTPYVDIPEAQILLTASLLFGYGGGRVMLKNVIAKKTPYAQDPPTTQEPAQ